jgi:PAS domain S-box-containing protein
LRKQLVKLQSENDRLKEIVTGSQPAPMTAQVLLDCDVDLPENVTNVVQELITCIESSDPSLGQFLHHDSSTGNAQRAFCICNPATADYPIVYSSPGFVHLTGYSMHHIIGRPCLFLDGSETDRREHDRLQAALANGREEVAVVRSYRRDGSPFWNRVQISPLRDGHNRVAFFVLVQYQVAGPAHPIPAPAHPHTGSGLPFTTYLSADRSGVSLASAHPGRLRRGNSHNNLSQRGGGSSGSDRGMMRSRSGTSLAGLPSLPPTDSSISALRSVIAQGHHHHTSAAHHPPQASYGAPASRSRSSSIAGTGAGAGAGAAPSFADDHSASVSSGSSAGYSGSSSGSTSGSSSGSTSCGYSSRNSSDNDNRSTDNDNRSEMSDADVFG